MVNDAKTKTVSRMPGKGSHEEPYFIVRSLTDQGIDRVAGFPLRFV